MISVMKEGMQEHVSESSGGKIELHVHLDCSMSYPVAVQIQPGLTEDEWRELLVAPGRCLNLADYLTRADRAVAMLQTEKALELITHDLFRLWKADGVTYGECRFAPLEHTSGGLTADRVLETVCNSFADCSRETGIGGGVIVCSLRHYSARKALESADLALGFQHRGVIGFDLAGDEAGFGLEPQIEAFRRVRLGGMPVTAHAGEACGAESIWEVLRYLEPTRIGHGVRCVEDSELMNVLRDNQIFLEICPTSNVQTGVVAKLEDHPVNRIYEHGIPLCINTDSRTTTPVSLSSEFALMRSVFGWTDLHFQRCGENARAARFLNGGL